MNILQVFTSEKNLNHLIAKHREDEVKTCCLLVQRCLLCWETHAHPHQYLLQYVFMLTPPPVILCGVDQQSSMVTFTRNKPDERLDTHYPPTPFPPSASRSRSDRPPWISHPPQSTHLLLFTWIKFAWPLLTFKGGRPKTLSPPEPNTKSCLFVWCDCLQVSVEVKLKRQNYSLGWSSVLKCKYLQLDKISIYLYTFSSWILPKGEVIKHIYSKRKENSSLTAVTLWTPQFLLTPSRCSLASNFYKPSKF